MAPSQHAHSNKNASIFPKEITSSWWDATTSMTRQLHQSNSTISSPPPSLHTQRKLNLPLIALLLCITIIALLIILIMSKPLYFITTTTPNHTQLSNHQQQQQQQQQTSPPPTAQSAQPEMAPNQDIFPNYLAIRTNRDPRKATNIRDIFREPGGSISSVMQPLLAARTNDDSPSEDIIIRMNTQKQDKKGARKDGSINWHGTNTLNTTWGWMA